MKTHVLTVSRTFPSTHKRKGEQTGFGDKIYAGKGIISKGWMKIHTIRANYDLWAKRITEVQEGKACCFEYQKKSSDAKIATSWHEYSLINPLL